MSFNALLIDFGTSRIKSTLFYSDKGSYEVNHVSAGSSFVGPIVPITFFTNALTEHLKCSTSNKISAIIICCEMHGLRDQNIRRLAKRNMLAGDIQP